MKYLFLVLVMTATTVLYSQSNNCFTANPFCSDQNYVFPNATNSTAPNGPNYGCLTNQPNPIWYYMEIANSGTVQLQVSQIGESIFPFFPPGPTDVDFAMWGPFSSVSAGCTAIMGGGLAPIQCSYSGNASETIGIGLQGGYDVGQSTPPAAIAGEVYIVLLTNFEGTTGEITFNQSGGTGSTDCSIVDPTTDCAMTYIYTHADGCEDGSIFQRTGYVEFQNAPTTGQLIIEDCFGNSVSFNPPFTSPQNFHIPDVTANGQICTVTAYFTADQGCSNFVNAQNTVPCDCIVDVGTFATEMEGFTNTTTVLCYGDAITVSPNGGFVPPPFANDPPYSEGYDPQVGWLIYSCPPTIGLVPEQYVEFEDDPCFLGIFSVGDLYDDNDLYYVSTGQFTNNTIYFVPVSMYHGPSGTVSYNNQHEIDGMDCYHTGPVFPVQYLTEITGTFDANCEAGTLSMTVQGGSPEINGTTFTAIVESPTHATVTTNNVSNGGTLVVSGLQDGDSYSILVQDEFGCPITFSGVFEGGGSAVIAYPETAYCKNVDNPIPTVTGSAGGVFSGTTGLVINPTTGVIDLSGTPAGNYTVTYELTGACSTNGTVDIQIFDVPVVVAVGDAICPNETAVLTASGADYYTWSPSNGLNTTTGATVSATVAGTQTYTVIGVNNISGCFSTAQATVYVTASPEALFSSNPKVGTQFNPNISFINNSIGGTSYQWNFGDGATSTATNPTHTYSEEPGSYLVTLIVTSSAGCVDTITSVMVIQEELIFYVPNTFTPDQDEFNQIFKPIFTSGFDPFDYTLQIFNRWGEMIFESHNAEIGWDGTYGNKGLCQDGTYTWKIEVKTSVSDERKMFVGHVNILR